MVIYVFSDLNSVSFSPTVNSEISSESINNTALAESKHRMNTHHPMTGPDTMRPIDTKLGAFRNLSPPPPTTPAAGAASASPREIRLWSHRTASATACARPPARAWALRSLSRRAAAAAVSGVADCESIHGGDERNSGPPDRTGTWVCAAPAKGAAAGVMVVGEDEARKVWRERSGLGFEIGVVLLRMRGFRVLRKAMAVDRGALQWSGPRRSEWRRRPSCDGGLDRTRWVLMRKQNLIVELLRDGLSHCNIGLHAISAVHFFLG